MPWFWGFSPFHGHRGALVASHDSCFLFLDDSPQLPVTEDVLETYQSRPLQPLSRAAPDKCVEVSLAQPWQCSVDQLAGNVEGDGGGGGWMVAVDMVGGGGRPLAAWSFHFAHRPTRVTPTQDMTSESHARRVFPFYKAPDF